MVGKLWKCEINWIWFPNFYLKRNTCKFNSKTQNSWMWACNHVKFRSLYPFCYKGGNVFRKNFVYNYSNICIVVHTWDAHWMNFFFTKTSKLKRISTNFLLQGGTIYLLKTDFSFHCNCERGGRYYMLDRWGQCMLRYVARLFLLQVSHPQCATIKFSTKSKASNKTYPVVWVQDEN